MLYWNGYRMSPSHDASQRFAWFALAAGLLIAASWAVTGRYLTLAIQPLESSDPDIAAALTRLTWGFVLFGITVGTLAVYGLVAAARRITSVIGRLATERDIAHSIRAALISDSPDVVLTLAENGDILSANRTIAGVIPAALAGRSLFDFIPHEHAPELRRRLRDAMLGEPSRIETRGAGVIDQHGWAEHRFSPVLGNDGAAQVMLITRDLTSVRRLEDALAQRFSQQRETATLEPIALDIPNVAPSLPDVASDTDLAPEGLVLALPQPIESLADEPMSPLPEDWHDRVLSHAIKLAVLTNKSRHS